MIYYLFFFLLPMKSCYSLLGFCYEGLLGVLDKDYIHLESPWDLPDRLGMAPRYHLVYS